MRGETLNPNAEVCMRLVSMLYITVGGRVGGRVGCLVVAGAHIIFRGQEHSGFEPFSNDRNNTLSK